MKTKDSFGNWLRQRRKALDLTQFDLANQVGCSVVTIRKIEANERRASKQIAERLADVLAISLEEREEFVAFARQTETIPPPPPLRSSATTPPHNLPPQPTSFIGRTDELAQIAERLDDPDCRLLTLVGAGGIGKTRLALQAAAEQLGSFANGVYFVSLTGVRSPNLVASAIAGALEIAFYGPEDPDVQLVNYLRGRTSLLILDNFEHLLEVTGLLCDILAAAPAVKLLVTSRERLNLREEWVIAMEGLAFPSTLTLNPSPSGEGPRVRARLDSYSAVQLFVQRARQAQTNFSLYQNAESVLSICRAVEGMPLGLELAATWLRGMSCPQIVEQMAQSLDFLVTPVRNVPERHRSLRAVFEQSWRLLSDSEQRVLAALSVFRGGFDLEAAEQVAGASPAVLAQFADKSLIRLNPSSRYDLHELLRQFAADKLAESGETATIGRRHLEFYLRLAEESDRCGGTFQVDSWYNRLEVELNNLQAALEWSLTDGDATAGLRLGGSLGWFWKNRFHRTEGRAWLEKILTFGHNEPASVRAKPLQRLGELALFLGDYVAAKIYCEASLAAAREAADKPTIAWSLSSLGLVANRQNDLNRSAVLLEESLGLFRGMGDELALSFALIRLGDTETYRGDYGRATAVLEEALVLNNEIGANDNKAWTYYRLGNTVRCQGDLTRAMALYQEGLALFRQNQNKMGIATISIMLGVVARSRGQYEQASLLFEKSLTVCLELIDKWACVYCVAGLGGLALKRGQPEFAARLMSAAEAHFSAVGHSYLPDRIAFQQDTAAVHAQLGEAAFAAAWAEGRAMTLEQASAYALHNK